MKRHKTGFSLEQIKEVLSAPPTEFQQSPDNPWVQLKKEQEGLEHEQEKKKD
jgi:DNA-binding transcriptional MerR regulator